MANETHVLHMDTDIMFVGTQEECQSRKDGQPFPTDCWKVHTLQEYGEACFEDGYSMCAATGTLDGPEC